MRPSDREERVNEAIAEWLEALERGRRLSRREFLERHADVSEELAAFLRDLGFLQWISAEANPPPK